VDEGEETKDTYSRLSSLVQKAKKKFRNRLKQQEGRQSEAAPEPGRGHLVLGLLSVPARRLIVHSQIRFAKIRRIFVGDQSISGAPDLCLFRGCRTSAMVATNRHAGGRFELSDPGNEIFYLFVLSMLLP